MLKITVYDNFLRTYLTGEFESVAEAKDFYSVELDCNPEDIRIIDVEDPNYRVSTLLDELGIPEDLVVEIIGDPAYIPFGYEKIIKDIATGDKLQVIEIFPKVAISDGSYHPLYFSNKHNLNIYLSRRIFKGDRR